MDRGRVCGAQKSYCCSTEVAVRCPLSSSPSFSHSGSGLRLCCSGSACAAAAQAFCLCQRELGHLEERDCGMTRTLLSHTQENFLHGEWIIEGLYTRKQELPRRSCSPARGEDAESYTQKQKRFLNLNVVAGLRSIWFWKVVFGLLLFYWGFMFLCFLCQ